jgi:hypothetical protein
VSAVLNPIERRFSSRVSVPYLARVSSVDVEGQSFCEYTRLDNISVGGLYLRLRRGIPKEASVRIAVCLSNAKETAGALRLAARGVVLRTEPQPDGTFGIAVEFSRRRVL